jgi:S-layer protein (TIGR01567 family)
LAIFIILILLNFAPAFVTAADIVEVRGVVAGTTGAVEMVEVRGQVATGDTTWNSQNFAGFYYDIKNDIGTETLSTTLTDRKLSGDSPYGVKYETKAQSKEFKFEDWGAFNVMGFLADRYFAGYVSSENVEKNLLFRESTDENSLSSEQLQKILIDDDTEKTVTFGTPIRLEEGYELVIKSVDIDYSKVYIELSKDGSVIDSKIVSPSKFGATMADKTYYYRNPQVGDQRKLVTIAAHFKNVFRGADQDMVTIDGLWQISSEATMVKADAQYDKMTITSVDANAGIITMENKDNAITLSKNKDTVLMNGIKIKTADNDALRYYIYKEITGSGTIQLRSQVATADAQWNAQNFAGFYYDFKDDIGTETLSTTLTDNKLSGDSPYGVTYMTSAQNKKFEYEGWGYYNVIGFLADEYFTSYSQSGTDSDMLDKANSTNLLESGQVTKVLIDDGKEKVIDLGSTITLAEGYALRPTLGTDKKGVLVELLYDGKVVDREALILPGSYVYISKAGNITGVPVIAAHFQEPIILDDKSYCKVDGLWQLSEKTTEFKADTQYDKMTITSIDANAGIITMENKDNAITLSKNMDTVLMDGINIKTADNDTLRYYLYRTVEIAPAGVNK